LAPGSVTVVAERKALVDRLLPASLLLGAFHHGSTGHMPATFAMFQRPRASRISLRVWRFVPDGPQWLYTYAGAIDHVVLGTVMQTIRRLTEAVPGDWIVDVVVVGVEHGLLRAMQDDLHDLRRHGVQPCLRHAPHPWLRRRIVAATPPLLH
jgi:hypothetical protein